ncbi:MAG TPA: phospho-N-acetylmuramoyl-pentapeptide-transferase, partial [Phormidium sp.]
MDAKSLDSRSLKLSGVNLSVILAVALSLVAIFLDGKTGRYLNPGVSLTLPFWVCAIATTGLGYWVVPLLTSLKAGQVIREDGPQSHLKKGGTPTMGGIFFIPVGVIISLVWSALSLGIKDFSTVAAVAGLTVGYGFIGWLDDWQILRRKS